MTVFPRFGFHALRKMMTLTTIAAAAAAVFRQAFSVDATHADAPAADPETALSNTPEFVM